MIPTFKRASAFVPEHLDAASWPNLAALYLALIERPLNTPASLETLILDRSELDAAVAEAGTLLYVRMTCHTDDPAANAAYVKFVESVEPEQKRAGFELDKKIASSPFAGQLDPVRYAVLLRNIRSNVELFRPENVPIETELTKLDQEYSQTCGAMTVPFRGEERTLAHMARYNEDTDRAVRESAWRLVAERRLRDREKIEHLYDNMIQRRHRLALNAGFQNFRDYAFRAKRRFDYTPRDCDAFAAAVETVCVPWLRRLNEERRATLGLTSLRPWDTQVDTRGRAPLRPFESADQLVQRTSRLFDRMDPVLSGLFRSLQTADTLDLDSRKGKAPGGYQATRDRQRLPFIFMNAAGVQRDVETMVHEAGHAFHALLSRADPILAYRSDIPLEFAEVASMSMELLAHDFLDEFYSPEDASRARRNHLEAIGNLLAWVATIDQFQHWVYTNPEHTRPQRTAKWIELKQRFGMALDWSGLEDYYGAEWIRIPHLFGAPFYYIEYGIAQLGSLQLWSAYLRDHDAALTAYRRSLSLGGSLPLPKLFEAAGLHFDFGESTVRRVWSDVERHLATLPA